jgi:hypothetical protein
MTKQSSKLRNVVAIAICLAGFSANSVLAQTYITTSSLPDGTVGQYYSATLTGMGTPPFSWSLVSLSSLPAELSLNASTGEISGTPTVSGTYSFSIELRDMTYYYDTKSFTLIINATTLTVLSSDNDLGNARSYSAVRSLITSTPSNESATFSGTAELIAIAKAGKVFTGWSDGNTDNPRTFIVSTDTTITAIFVPDSSSTFKNQITGLKNDTATLNSQIATLTGDLADCETAREYLQALLDSCMAGQNSIKNIPEGSPLKVYPNPTTGQLHVTNVKGDQRAEIGIYDVVGRMQKVEGRMQKADGKTIIDISHLPVGVYFLRIGTETVKVVKQ